MAVGKTAKRRSAAAALEESKATALIRRGLSEVQSGLDQFPLDESSQEAVQELASMLESFVESLASSPEIDRQTLLPLTGMFFQLACRTSQGAAGAASQDSEEQYGFELRCPPEARLVRARSLTSEEIIDLEVVANVARMPAKQGERVEFLALDDRGQVIESVILIA
jgi:hypothetical protein